MYLDENGIAHIEDTDPVSPLSSLINPLQAATSEVVGNLSDDTGWLALDPPEGAWNSESMIRVKRGWAFLSVNISPASPYSGGTVIGVAPPDERWAHNGDQNTRFLVYQATTGTVMFARLFPSGQVNIYAVPPMSTSQSVMGMASWPVG